MAQEQARDESSKLYPQAVLLSFLYGVITCSQATVRAIKLNPLAGAGTAALAKGMGARAPKLNPLVGAGTAALAKGAGARGLQQS